MPTSSLSPCCFVNESGKGGWLPAALVISKDSITLADMYKNAISQLQELHHFATITTAMPGIILCICYCGCEERVDVTSPDFCKRCLNRCQVQSDGSTAMYQSPILSTNHLATAVPDFQDIQFSTQTLLHLSYSRKSVPYPKGTSQGDRLTCQWFHRNNLSHHQPQGQKLGAFPFLRRIRRTLFSQLTQPWPRPASQQQISRQQQKTRQKNKKSPRWHSPATARTGLS